MTPFIIEKNIFQNGYFGPEDIVLLKNLGITHLLNLHHPYPFSDQLLNSGFVIKQIFLTDPAPIEKETAFEIVDFINDTLLNSQNKIYIHCYAGVNRSPTAVWLYFLAKGYSESEATKRIISGNKNLVVPDPFIISNLDLHLIKNRYL